jgi:hypothetical protein
MTLRAAFLFVAPQADPVCHRSVITTPQVELITVGVKDYREGVQAAKDLVEEGVGAIELCAGFGTEGVVLIKKAVNGKAVVGVVRFDHHPGLGFKSGDELFQ